MEGILAFNWWREMMLGFGQQMERLVYANAGIFVVGKEAAVV